MTVPLSCREFTEFLTAYVDSELLSNERAEFERHISACPPCGVYLDSYRETVRLARLCAGGRTDPPADAPEGLITAILAARRAGRAQAGDGRAPAPGKPPDA
jgi:anti-sigma factor RsiW